MSESRLIPHRTIPRGGGKPPPWGRPKLHRPRRSVHSPLILAAGRLIKRLIRGEGRAGPPMTILRLLE